MALSAIEEPLQLDLKVKRNDSFGPKPFTLTQGGSPIDLTGYEAKAQIRDLKGKLLAEFTVAIAAPTTGVVTLALDTTQTANLRGKLFWDLQIVLTADPPNNTHTIVEGAVIVTNDRTR